MQRRRVLTASIGFVSSVGVVLALGSPAFAAAAPGGAAGCLGVGFSAMQGDSRYIALTQQHGAAVGVVPGFPGDVAGYLASTNCNFTR